MDKFDIDECTIKTVLNYYSNYVIVTDARGQVLFITDNGARLYGEKAEDLINKSVYDFVQSRRIDHSVIAEAIKSKKKAISKLITDQGNEITCAATPVFNSKGEVKIIIAHIQDEASIKDIVNEIKLIKKKNSNVCHTIDFLQNNSENNTDIVIESNCMKMLYNAMRSVAKTDSTIMIYGESGTGKEVLARFIHKSSNRAKETFIPINCATIPNELMEAEFFGYERGSFTGANSEGKAGIFETADNGTIFLDELGEMPLSIQSKLLRVLENGEIKRIGGNKIINTDVRIIAATNRDLKKMVEEKTFREDLYYRVNVIPVRIPPLRERTEDIPKLVKYYTNMFNRKYDKNWSCNDELIKSFIKYQWPGNIRELRNEIERMVITDYSDKSPFFGKFINNENSCNNCNKNHKSLHGPLKEVVKKFEMDYIREILKQCDGNISKAAEILGVNRSVIYYKLKQ